MPLTQPKTDLAYLRSEKAKAEQKLRACQHREKILERQMSELNRRERVHRLCTRAGMLESFLVVLAEQPFAALISGPGNSGLTLAALDDGDFEMRTRNRYHLQTKRPPSKIALDERSGIVFGFARRLGTECYALWSQAGAAKG